MFLGGNRVFLYRGKNSQGKYIEGRVRAKNSQWARYMLRKKASKYSHYNRVGIYPLLAAKLYRHRILSNLPDSSPP